MFEEGFRPGPRAALSVGRVEEDSFVLQMSAIFIPLSRGHALSMLEVVVVGKAHVTVEHHLEVI